MSAESRLKGWIPIRCRGCAISAILLVAAICAGCGSVPRTHYYTLRAPAPPSALQTKTDFILQVERFEASEMFRDDRIVYYTSPTELNFYDYHRWSSSPPELLSEVAVKSIAESGLFKGVYLYPAPVHADYTLRGRVLNLAEMDYERSGNEKAGKARVGLALDLVRTRDNEVVWSTRKETEIPIAQKGMKGVVDALNAASQQLLADAISGMAQVVEKEFASEQKESH